MRYIEKPDDAPEIITSFIERQMAARPTVEEWEAFPVDYPSFDSTETLREILSAEQGGLCGYTGAAIDGRLQCRQPRPAKHWYTPHIEHLKPQSQCRQELRELGLVPGRDVGQDIDDKNLIAALEVAGSRTEWFGAVLRKDDHLPVWPTQTDCDKRFRFLDNGGIDGDDADASASIQILDLNHRTLRGWRHSALRAFLPEDEVIQVDYLRELIAKMDDIQDAQLPEFCFAVRSVAARLLGE